MKETSSKQKLEKLQEEALVFLVDKSPQKLWCYMVMVMKVGDNELQNILWRAFPWNFTGCSHAPSHHLLEKAFWSAI